jgi:hypothetical protein
MLSVITPVNVWVAGACRPGSIRSSTIAIENFIDQA